jgi:hypothetical protein
VKPVWNCLRIVGVSWDWVYIVIGYWRITEKAREAYGKGTARMEAPHRALDLGNLGNILGNQEEAGFAGGASVKKDTEAQCFLFFLFFHGNYSGPPTIIFMTNNK